MVNVANEHIDQSPHADRKTTGGAAAVCIGFWHVLYHEDICATQLFELVEQFIE